MATRRVATCPQAWGAGLFGKKPKNPMRQQTDELYDLLTTDAPTTKYVQSHIMSILRSPLSPISRE